MNKIVRMITLAFDQPKQADAQGGYTLVELLVTIFVGSILAGGVTTLLSSHTFLSQRGRDVSVANSYTENKFEALRSAGFLSLADGTTDLTNELPSELNSPRTGSLVVSSPSASIKQAVISISYNDQGAPRTYSYTTYIGELGVGQY